MLHRDIKNRINDIHQLLVGKMALPSERLELITVALIFKFMEDMDKRSKSIGGKISYFKGSLANHSWSKVLNYKPKPKENAAAKLVENFEKAIKAIAKAGHIPDFFRSIFKNISLRLTDGKILKMFMDEINHFEYSHSEELGNAYEYMLEKQGIQKEIGAFRTPRNIIAFIVKVVDPKIEDTILDPACGTAGFLIEAANHIKKQNTSPKYIDQPGKWGDRLRGDISKLSKNIQGYDNTPLMARLSKVNMYLHNLTNPLIYEYDTISSYGRWNEKFDCILANPPFYTPKGAGKPHDKFRIPARKTELLFSDYILEHLNPGGKAGFVVPEGIISNSSNFHFVELREWAINHMGLWAVVSLPPMVFQPYSGVKTSILFFDRSTAKQRKDIILLKIENDGFSLNVNRTQIDKDDLPEAEEILLRFKQNKSLDGKEWKVKFNVVPKIDFAKVDAYRAATTAKEVYSRAFKKLVNAAEEFAEAVKKNPDKKDKLLESFGRAAEQFAETTGMAQPKYDVKRNQIKLHLTEEDWTEFFEKHIKEKAIQLGAMMEVKGLSKSIVDAINYARVYDLSIEKSNSVEQGQSEYDVVKLAEVSEIIPGQSPPGSSYNEKGKGLPFYQGKTEYGLRYLNKPTQWTTHVTRVSVKEDILFSMRAPVGAININPFDEICIGRGLAAIRVGDKIKRDYLFHILNSGFSLLNARGNTGAIFDSITKEQLESIEIPLPLIEKQVLIATELESYQRVIDSTDALIDNYVPAFYISPDWKTIKLGDISDVVRGSSPRPKGDKRYYGGHVPRLMVADVTRDGLYTTPQIDSLTEEGAKLSRPMKKGDVIITVSGNPGLPTILACDACIHDGFVGLRDLDTDILNPEYLYFVLLNLHATHKADAVGATFQNLTTDYIKDVSIPIPTMEAQLSIVDELLSEYHTIEGCKKLKTKMENKIREVIKGVWGVKEEEQAASQKVEPVAA